MKKYLFYDTETGGLDPQKHSLLSATFRVTDVQFQTLEQLSFKLRPEDNVFRVTASAMKVNKIDLVKHQEEAVTYKEAKSKLLYLLARHSNNGMSKLTPVGKKVSFDDGFITAQLVPDVEWAVHVTHRSIDIGSVAEFLKTTNIIPGSIPGSLSGLATFFGVSEAGAHTDVVDVNMTVNVLKAMKARITR